MLSLVFTLLQIFWLVKNVYGKKADLVLLEIIYIDWWELWRKAFYWKCYQLQTTLYLLFLPHIGFYFSVVHSKCCPGTWCKNTTFFYLVANPKPLLYFPCSSYQSLLARTTIWRCKCTAVTFKHNHIVVAKLTIYLLYVVSTNFYVAFSEETFNKWHGSWM